MSEIKFLKLLSELGVKPEQWMAATGQVPQENKIDSASIIVSMLEMQNQYKSFHFQTFGLGEHQALGKIYDSLSDLIDSFTEKFIGKYGRYTLGQGASMQLVEYSKEAVTALANTNEEFLKGLSNIIPDDTDLLNIRDEMLGEINQLRYLLTLS